MANPRARPHVNTANTEYYLPQRPPSWLQPSICTQPDFHSLNSSLDLLFMVNQHLRRHPLNTDPMPDQTYFQDQRAYNLLYRMRGDLILPGSPTPPICHHRTRSPRAISHQSHSLTLQQKPGHSTQHTSRLPTTTRTLQPFTFSSTTYTTARRGTISPSLDRSSTANYSGPPSTLPLASENALAPVTPAVAKYNIRPGSAAATMHLPTPEKTPPATVADTLMFLGLTDISRRAGKPRHLTGFPLLIFFTEDFITQSHVIMFPQPFDRTVSP